MKIAIIGAGIAGNVVASRLHPRHGVTVFEAARHVGGHSHSHDIYFGGERHTIDTGFIVFNRRTYPLFCELLDALGVASQESSMTFSVRDDAKGLEYNGGSLKGLFAQRRNLLRPSFHRMLREILRFNREAPRLLADQSGGDFPLGQFLEEGGYGRAFVEDYLLPMGGAIWSTDPRRMLDFPARFLARFMFNHGMLSLGDRPVWRTVTGGSARYVEQLVAPFRDRIRLATPVEWVRRRPRQVLVKPRGAPAEAFDHVFIACHADQALALLADPSAAEREVLCALPYQANEAVLHTDASLLPRSRLAWAAWNAHVLDPGQPVALTYNMNVLQRLTSRHTFCVTLNRTRDIEPSRILRRMVYHHPLFTPAGVAAQRRQRELNGPLRTWYCGAYWRYGFHEDGVWSALEALRHFKEAIDAERPVPRVA
ncbi:MAG TPA: FAD-dependent oxidoreductase [Burkholderiales bacterium]|nr:FAD-dependent oxidoreductase [Burkholderiales bacterium]